MTENFFILANVKYYDNYAPQTTLRKLLQALATGEYGWLLFMFREIQII